MHLRELMTANPAVCTPDATLQDVAVLMVEHDCGAIPVVETLEQRQPVGIVTDRDLVTRTVAQGINPLTLHAQDVMTEKMVRVPQDAQSEEAIALMTQHRVRRLLVVDGDGAVVGIIAQADLAREMPPAQTGDFVDEISEPGLNPEPPAVW